MCLRVDNEYDKFNRFLERLSGCVFLFVLCGFFCFVLFLLFRAEPEACGGSQARGQIRATAAGLCQSHSNARSEPPLQPIPQLMATPDP